MTTFARLLLLPTLLLYWPSTLFCQHTLRGMVCGPDSLPAVGTNVLLVQADSIVAYTVNQSKGFVFTYIPPGDYRLKASSIGYKPIEVSLSIHGDTNVGRLIFKEGYDLGEVAITAARKVISQKGGLTKVVVRNTFLSELPSMENLFEQIPGLLVSEDGIKSYGKGETLILINGKEMTSKAQLQSLQPSQVTEVTVDNTPGAKYDTRYASVVHIRTVRQRPALLLYTRGAQARRFSNTSGMAAQWNLGKFTFNTSYEYRKRENKSYTSIEEESFQPAATFQNKYTDTTFSCRTSHDWSVELRRKDKRHDVTIGYLGYYSDNKPSYRSLLNHTQQSDSEQSHIARTGKYRVYQHSASVNYVFDIGKDEKLSVMADYLHQATRNGDNTLERAVASGNTQTTTTRFTGSDNLLSALGEYEKRIKSFNLLAGIRYSHVSNKSQSDINSSVGRNELLENRQAAYIVGSFHHKEMLFQVGVRAELFGKQYKYNAETTLDNSSLTWYPSFLISTPISNWLQLSIAGNKKTSIPSFNELSPIITYYNRYAYSSGNPSLKPADIYSVDLSITLFNDFTFSAGYNETKNDRTEIAESDPTNNLIIQYHPVNIDRWQQWSGTLAYRGRIARKHTMNMMCGILIP
ncbi:MAG: TonB-dependent receptor family protein, partial [Mediterranea sp.]|nr:TonB-dependent receptor family protein [Mediterranea sp.]